MSTKEVLSSPALLQEPFLFTVSNTLTANFDTRSWEDLSEDETEVWSYWFVEGKDYTVIE